ncbi:BnaAnng38670D [Brassica napus]|uniref:Uncharacterized protein n=2 Tax=Brassica TaxID=3705 RepID=A0A3P5ZSP2_BRACM|nr:unnamed protein product [Brassica napus]CDY71743.1 BnaAnng38670D [Brassica napus]VDC79625.1 unnamed protein product [Brassica rapa]
MYARSPTTQWKKDAGNQTDDIGSEPQMSYEGVGSEAMDTEMKNVGGSSSEAKLTQPEGQTTVSLSVPQFASEACAASKTAVARSGSEDEKSTKDAVTRGMGDKPVSHVGDVPEELQLELGDKKMSASAVASETNHDHSASSKCEFV